MARQTQRLARDLRSIGEHVAGWRKINDLTAAMVAERAGIDRDTLRAIENGDSSTTANLVSVLRVLGVFDTVTDALDPLASDFGRANAHRLSRERVRA
ncbi:MAG TPA: helix-turn-helix transcriptional regulator [Steroidobacteraceae bacterium]